VPTADEVLLEAEDDLRMIAQALEQRPATLEQSPEGLNLILAVSRQMTRVLNLDQLLDVVMDSVMQLTRAERGFLMLYDSDGILKFRVIRNPQGQVWEGTDYQVSHTITARVLESGQPLWVKDASAESQLSRSASITELKIRSCMCVPLWTTQSSERKIFGLVYVDSQQIQESFSAADLELLSALAAQAAIAIENAQLVENIRRLEEEKRLKLEEENRSLQQIIESKSELLGQSRPMEQVFSMIRRVSGSEVSVLILGESGTGKTLVARTIHELSQRREKPFIVIDCGAIPENLLESELFGYEKGAFTGAYGRKLGKFELANGGTVFLEEIGELPASLQIKLLRVLQQGELEHIGGRETIKVDVRVVAATNRDLEQDVKSGRFRQDLFYRLNIITINLPPLRDREGDILMLAGVFLEKYASKHRKRISAFTAQAKAALQAYSWPGNVRELEHKVERAVIMCDGERLEAEHLELEAPPTALPQPATSAKLKQARRQLEEQMLRQALARSRGDISATARELGIPRQQVYRLLARYRIPHRKQG
jgi:transcriptional regulator with GAF, ATPase, and Fis domain